MMRLEDDRLHFQHGPIDLIVLAEGPFEAVKQAYAQGWRRFRTVLDELVARTANAAPARNRAKCPPSGRHGAHHDVVRLAIPRPLHHANGGGGGIGGGRGTGAMVLATPIRRGMVNNGGDIAIYLANDEKLTVGVVERPDFPEIAGTITIESSDPVARHRHLRLARPQPEPRHRRRGDRARPQGREGGCGGDDDRQRGQHRSSGDLRAPGGKVKDDSDLGDIPVTMDVARPAAGSRCRSARKWREGGAAACRSLV